MKLLDRVVLKGRSDLTGTVTAPRETLPGAFRVSVLWDKASLSGRKYGLEQG